MSDVLSGPDGERTWAIGVGTGPNQGDLLFHDQRSLAQSATEDLDLVGVLTDALGDILNFVQIKTMYFASAGLPGAVDANTSSLKIGGAAVNGFDDWVNDPTDRLILRPEGFFLLNAQGALSYAVAGGTADLLKIEHDGVTVDDFVYDVILIGASA